MEILESIKTAAPIFAEHKDSDWEVLEQALVNAGISPPLTTRLIEFMPLAFARALLEGMGIAFEEYYVRHDPQTNRNQHTKLADETVYRESFEAASSIMAQKLAGDAFMAVALRSSELAAVNDALNNGSKPEDLVMSPPVMLWDEGAGAHPEAPKSQQAKNRWRFWE